VAGFYFRINKLEDDEENTYLLRPAVDILKSHANLTAEQIAYLDAYTIEIEFDTPENELPSSDPEDIGHRQDAKFVAGKTTFADLLDWGVPVEQIEAILGGEIPNRLVLVRDYCAENGLSFGVIKAELQAVVDKLE
jgi:hypothetical protein